jgi:spore coat protein U-like protein
MAAGTNFVPYGLFRDAGRTLAWGTTIGTNTLSGVGTGAAVSTPVYGRVTSRNAPAGTYTDTITATITY